jgi:hypothetical protein
MQTRVIGAALLGAAILLLGSGCGSKNDTGKTAGPAPANTAPAGTTAAKSAATSCPSSATVGDQLDMTFPTEPDVNKATDAFNCSYRGKKKGTDKSVFVLLAVYENLSASYMDNFRQQDAEWKPVTQPGIGDDAFSFQTQSINTTLNNLVVRKGNRIAQVGGNATLAQLTSLLNIVLGA